VIVVPNAPEALYRVFPDLTTKVAESLGTTADVTRSRLGDAIYERPRYILPPFDASLPAENRLMIEKIGVNTKIGEGEDWDQILKNGVWRVPNFGIPVLSGRPMILAAHRFGYLAWTNSFRRANSFFNLPKLQNGDRIEIVWNQRKYTYEIYEGYSDTKIRDYGADLILYTCEMLNSDRRIIRLARLIDDPNTQRTSQAPDFGSLIVKR
jgi:sortase (surface protein transpeptidase)